MFFPFFFFFKLFLDALSKRTRYINETKVIATIVRIKYILNFIEQMHLSCIMYY